MFLWQTSTKSFNFARFSNADYDRLMDETSVTSDQGKRARLLEQAEQVLLREMPILPRNCPGSCSQTVRSERINLSGSCISI
jgi:ABC-type oligopeptide transport system substrate-binding subunit